MFLFLKTAMINRDNRVFECRGSRLFLKQAKSIQSNALHVLFKKFNKFYRNLEKVKNTTSNMQIRTTYIKTNLLRYGNWICILFRNRKQFLCHKSLFIMYIYGVSYHLSKNNNSNKSTFKQSKSRFISFVLVILGKQSDNIF